MRSMFIFFVSFGMTLNAMEPEESEKKTIKGASWYAVFKPYCNRVSIHRGRADKNEMFDSYSGSCPTINDRSKAVVALLNNDNDILHSQTIEANEFDDWFEFATAVYVVTKLLDPDSLPYASTASLCELYAYGKSIKFFDAKHNELGCFRWPLDDVTIDQITSEAEFSKFINVSEVATIIDQRPQPATSSWCPIL